MASNLFTLGCTLMNHSTSGFEFNVYGFFVQFGFSNSIQLSQLAVQRVIRRKVADFLANNSLLKCSSQQQQTVPTWETKKLMQKFERHKHFQWRTKIQKTIEHFSRVSKPHLIQWLPNRSDDKISVLFQKLFVADNFQNQKKTFGRKISRFKTNRSF